MILLIDGAKREKMKRRIFILGLVLALSAIGCGASSTDSSGEFEGSTEAEGVEEASAGEMIDSSGQQIMYKGEKYYVLSTYDNCLRCYDSKFGNETVIVEPGKSTPSLYNINEFTVGKSAVYVCGKYNANDSKQHVLKIIMKDGKVGSTEEIYSFASGREAQLEYDNDTGALNIYFAESSDSKKLDKAVYADGKLTIDENIGDVICSLQGTIYTDEWQKRNLNYKLYTSDNAAGGLEYAYSVENGAVQTKINIPQDSEIIAAMNDYAFFFNENEKKSYVFDLETGNVKDITSLLGEIDVRNVYVGDGLIYYSAVTDDESVLNSYDPEFGTVETILKDNMEDASIIGIANGKLLFEAKKEYDTYLFCYDLINKTIATVGKPLDVTYIGEIGYIDRRTKNINWSNGSDTVVGTAKLGVLVLNDDEAMSKKINDTISEVYDEMVESFADEITEELPDEDVIPDEDKDAYMRNTLSLQTTRLSYLDKKYLSFCIDGYKLFNGESVRFYIRKDVIIDRSTGKLVQISDIAGDSDDEILEKIKEQVKVVYKLTDDNEEDVSLLDRISLNSCSFLMNEKGFIVHIAPGLDPVSEEDYLVVNIEYSH